MVGRKFSTDINDENVKWLVCCSTLSWKPLCNLLHKANGTKFICHLCFDFCNNTNYLLSHFACRWYHLFSSKYWANCKKENKISVLLPTDRSSHQRCSIKKVFLKILRNFTAKHLSQSAFFNKVAGLRHLWPNTPLSSGEDIGSIPLISSVLAKFCSEGLKKREKKFKFAEQP